MAHDVYETKGPMLANYRVSLIGFRVRIWVRVRFLFVSYTVTLKSGKLPSKKATADEKSYYVPGVYINSDQQRQLCVFFVPFFATWYHTGR